MSRTRNRIKIANGTIAENARRQMSLIRTSLFTNFICYVERENGRRSQERLEIHVLKN